ncbi:MAG: SIMPL domain-containing protein [Eubacteriales bacterium]
MGTITVKGVGRVSAKPDFIVLSMTIESKNRTYDTAMSEAAARIEKLRDAAVQAGYEKEILKTTSFHVETCYENVREREGNYHREFTGYTCIYHLKMSFDFDNGQLAAVISRIAESGAKPELHIAFTVKNPAAIHEALLVNAVENAKSKADILANASGHALGELMNIDYNWAELNIMSGTRCEVEDSIQPLMATRMCAAPEIEPEDIDVSDTVSITWALR